MQGRPRLPSAAASACTTVPPHFHTLSRDFEAALPNSSAAAAVPKRRSAPGASRCPLTKPADEFVASHDFSAAAVCHRMYKGELQFLLVRGRWTRAFSRIFHALQKTIVSAEPKPHENQILTMQKLLDIIRKDTALVSAEELELLDRAVSSDQGFTALWTNHTQPAEWRHNDQLMNETNARTRIRLEGVQKTIRAEWKKHQSGKRLAPQDEWAMPKGAFKRGETALVTAQRELQEEAAFDNKKHPILLDQQQAAHYWTVASKKQRRNQYLVLLSLEHAEDIPHRWSILPQQEIAVETDAASWCSLQDMARLAQLPRWSLQAAKDASSFLRSDHQPAVAAAALTACADNYRQHSHDRASPTVLQAHDADGAQHGSCATSTTVASTDAPAPAPASLALPCKSCGANFPFSIAEQTYFKEKKYPPPVRCVPCRATKKRDQQEHARHRHAGGSSHPTEHPSSGRHHHGRGSGNASSDLTDTNFKQQGWCRFGERCHFAHEGLTI